MIDTTRPAAIVGRRTPQGFAGAPLVGNGAPDAVGPNLWRYWLAGKNAEDLKGCVDILVEAGFSIELLAVTGQLLETAGNARTFAGIRRAQRPGEWHGVTQWRCCLPAHCLWPAGVGYADGLPVIPWAYVIDDEARILFVLEAQRATGCWRWVLRCEAPLDGPEPEWTLLEQDAPRDASPWPPGSLGRHQVT